MRSMNQILALWRHLFWADQELVQAVVEQAGTARAVREMAHVLGTEETWLARIEGRAADVAVWPDVGVEDLTSLLERAHASCHDYLERLREGELAREIRYTNSAGQRFTNSVADILLHVALHGQYHRGKANLLLRDSGLKPAPTDYIAWVRGTPAATGTDAQHSQGGDS